MDLQLIGSNELLYIKTPKVSLTIKGKASHPNFEGIEYNTGDSSIKIYCLDNFDVDLKQEEIPSFSMQSGGIYSGVYSILPMFYEQQNYEILVEGVDDHKVSFWHDNINIRNKISKASRHHEILSGVINFGNEIGLSDLVIKVDGSNYLRLTIEVFPSKIDYKEDYKKIVEDVTKEVYSVVFDFLKKTYQGYKQGESMNSSPVEFFAVVTKIFSDFLKATDMILANPHHLLEKNYEVQSSHKVKRTDNKSLRWIEKHPESALKKDNRIYVERTLAVKKQVTYDTKENRLTKYILQNTVRKLESFKKNYMNLQRKEDVEVINRIDRMIRELNRRCNNSFLGEVDAQETSSGMSLVFSMAPGYRDLYKYYLMLLRGLSITGDVFNISVKDIALLYEYWCFIKLNSLMKDRYELISQDVVKVQGNGLFVALVKGASSKVKYRNPENGEMIILSYNPTSGQSPTAAQRPDNVLSLEKKTVNHDGVKMKYEYVFDAKYRVNPALEGTEYYNSVGHTPGPEISDINTMHRYRDAIVYANGGSPYERSMFGAYVLFPYANEDEYRTHKFFESVDKVNIGGLPFLPSATSMVENMLDALISDSPDSAFERATLPRGIEVKLAKVDWDERDVLVGDLRNQKQLDICLSNNFYHMPADRISKSDFPIRYVAIYQSKRQFDKNSGIRWYGEVISVTKVKRSEITEIPKNSDKQYYRFEINEWKKLDHVLEAKEIRDFPFFTNIFLLKNCDEVPDLLIGSDEEYRLYTELKRIAASESQRKDADGCSYNVNGKLLYVDNGEIVITDNKKIINKIELKTFAKKPSAVFRLIKYGLMN